MKTLQQLKVSLLKKGEKKLKNYIWQNRDVIFESDFCEWFLRTQKEYRSEQRTKFWKEEEGKEFIEKAQLIWTKRVDKDLMEKGCESYQVCSPFTDDVEKLRDANSLLKEKHNRRKNV